MSEPLEAYYGLPQKVTYCKQCVISNQRPSSFPEFKHQPTRKAPTIRLDDLEICDACKYTKEKEAIDWKTREDELLKLLDKHRSKDGSHDCILPGSGGKDSVYAAHVLKHKYGMHPLTVTWPPFMYTDYGWKNFQSWLNVGGFDNITFKPNGRVHRLLTKLSIQNLLHPFQPFILGQKNIAPKIALQYNIPLVFYGEPEAEYGNPIAETQSSLRDKSYFATQDLSEIYLSGLSVPELMNDHKLTLGDLKPYFPADYNQLENSNIQVHYLGYYLKWTPQEAYYYSVEHTNFQARPFRSEGTYSKYNSIDDKIDDLHFYTTYIKFGIGRCTSDASQEIRNKHIDRDEGIALVKRFDGEQPQRYIEEVMAEFDMTPDQFFTHCDKFRSPHLWKQEQGDWKLRNPIWEADQ